MHLWFIPQKTKTNEGTGKCFSEKEGVGTDAGADDAPPEESVVHVRN